MRVVQNASVGIIKSDDGEYWLTFQSDAGTNAMLNVASLVNQIKDESIRKTVVESIISIDEQHQRHTDKMVQEAEDFLVKHIPEGAPTDAPVKENALDNVIEGNFSRPDDGEKEPA
jgi:hypothetical protein